MMRVEPFPSTEATELFVIDQIGLGPMPLLHSEVRVDGETFTVVGYLRREQGAPLRVLVVRVLIAHAVA